MNIYNKIKKNKFEKIHRYEKDVNGKIGRRRIITPKDNVKCKINLDKNIIYKILWKRPLGMKN